MSPSMSGRKNKKMDKVEAASNHLFNLNTSFEILSKE